MKKIRTILLSSLVIALCITGCDNKPFKSVQDKDIQTEVAQQKESTLNADRPFYKAAGDYVAKIDLPVPSAEEVGIGIAVNCEDPVTMYYTNTWSPFLHTMTNAGIHIASIPLTDAAGNSISIGAIAWDESRQMIWGGTDSEYTVVVHLINPNTGICIPIFTMNSRTFGFCDGIAFDGSDNSIWVTDDVSDNIEHWDVSGIDASGAGTASFIVSIIPTDASGATLGLISGVSVGKGDILYIGRNGAGEIVRTTKAGVYVNKFATVTGRDEDLECDLITFAPKEVLWSRDAYTQIIEAFELEEGTCVCGGERFTVVPLDIKPTSCPNPINVKSKGKLPVAILGTENFDITEIDVTSIYLMGVPPTNDGQEDVATPFSPYSGKEDCYEDCNTLGPDGFMDLTLKFDNKAIVAALGSVNDGDCLVLTLTGTLLDGSSFTGEDVVVIISN